MKDALLYQGQEWHDLGYEEIGNADEELFEFLRASNRSSIEGIPARCQLSWNWGGRGHKWLKRRFVDHDLRQEEQKDSYFFIPSLIEDNPALMKADPGYGDRILSMANPALRKAWRYGDFDIEAGQFFDLKRSVHIVQDFVIPEHWPIYVGYDYGWAHPAAMVWMTVDEQSQAYIFRVWSRSKATLQDVADEFFSHKEAGRVKEIYAGHDCWVDRGAAWREFEKHTSPTVAEQLGNFGMHLIPANISRKQGWALLRQGLEYEIGTDQDGDPAIIKEPKLHFFESAKMAFENLSDRVHNPSDLEDVLKEDFREGVEGSGDDISDSLRYVYVSRFSKALAPKDPRDKYRIGRKEHRPSWLTA